MKKFENFKKNLRVLRLSKDQDLTNEFIVGGIIDKFYIQFELSWKVLKELLILEGVAEAKTGSPRDIIKMSYKFFDFIDENSWLSMLSDRNSVAHTYDENAAKLLVDKIINSYITAFDELENDINKRCSEDFS